MKLEFEAAINDQITDWINLKKLWNFDHWLNNLLLWSTGHYRVGTKMANTNTITLFKPKTVLHYNNILLLTRKAQIVSLLYDDACVYKNYIEKVL